MRAVDGWHAVDGEGRDPATGQPPRPPGAPSPAAALAGVPVAAWPLVIVSSRGLALGVAEALGPGGRRVAGLLDRLARRAPPPDGLPVEALVRATPAGTVDLPVVAVGLGEALEVAAEVDRAWLGAVEERRAAPRSLLTAHGREPQLEAALNLAMLLATERLGGQGDELGARVASGARLWLLGGVVGWALLATGDGDPFASWADLVSYGLWPLGPAGGRLVLCADPRATARDEPALVVTDP